MATALINFPLALVSDGLISYLQFVFSSDEHTPSSYRWNSNDRSSRIKISGPFVVESETPNSSPYITVERGGFGVNKKAIDDTKGADANTFDNEHGVMITDGTMIITVGSSVASEASSIANYIMVQLQSDRHGIMDKLGFVRNFNVSEVSPEEPVVKESEIKRWKVAITIQTSIQMGWIKREKEDKWEKFSVKAKLVEDHYDSDSGIILSGEDTITDSNANFGYPADSSPSFIESEFDKGWYYLQFDGEDYVYNVVEIVDSNTLRLAKDAIEVDIDGKKSLNKDGEPFSPKDSESCKKYRLFWNAVHLHVEI